MREETGEYMELLWEGERPYECVRGHVSKDEARRALNSEQKGLGDGELTIEHKYARWGFPDSMFGSEGYDRMLNVYNSVSQGRFKITIVWKASQKPFDVTQD